MNKNRGLTIASLIVAIIGLSIGFAAFSNTLMISSSATVNPDSSTMNVVWSSSSSSAATSSITPTLTPNNVANFTATNGSITGNDSRTLENISASFTAPGQTVTYSLYVFNAGQLQAQLTGITFNNAAHASSGETYKHCQAKTTKMVNNEEVSLTSGEMATDSLVSAACEGISISVSIGTATDVTPSTTGDKAALNYQLINKNSALEATVTITYASGSAYVDGPMEVEFGDITINATSAVDPTRVVASSPSTPSPSSVTCVISNNVGSSAITVGDKITCGTESFYVIEDLGEGSTVKMLSEWNLNLGTGFGMNDYSPIPYGTSTIGYQDSHVRGMVDYVNDSTLTQYLYNEDNDMNDMLPYGTVSSNSVSSYVNAYVTNLNAMLNTTVAGRLVTIEELDALGCSSTNWTCTQSPATAPSWVYQTSYWTESTYEEVTVSGTYIAPIYVLSFDYQGVSINSSDEYANPSASGIKGWAGVRPVIEISSSAIQTS